MRIANTLCWAIGTLSLIASAMAGATDLVEKKNVIFMHPDLGIGGAERLVIDAAVGLQSMGHNVTVFTSYCDPGHAFEETQDGTRLHLPY